jgi:hypothetical protein
MSARYIQSLRYNVRQCDFILESLGAFRHSSDQSSKDDHMDAVDFIYDLMADWQREIADVTAGMARQEARIV